MKRSCTLALLLFVTHASYAMETPAPQSPMDVFGQFLQTLGIDKNQTAVKWFSVATVAAGVYSFCEISYRRYARWARSNDPKKADFDGFVQSLATDALTQMGVVTYEELDEAIQQYLDQQDLQLTHDEIADIAREVAQRIVDERAQKLSARIDLLEQSQTA